MDTTYAARLGRNDATDLVAMAREILFSDVAPEDDACAMIDGQAYSPSWRACRDGEVVFRADNDGSLSEAYVGELDSVLEGAELRGYSYEWHDGILWLVGPDAPEDLFA